MIKPTKFLNPDKSVLFLSTIILKQLIRFRILKVEDIIHIIDTKIGQNSRDLLAPSLSFLYLLDVIEYNEMKDCIIYKAKNNET